MLFDRFEYSKINYELIFFVFKDKFWILNRLIWPSFDLGHWIKFQCSNKSHTFYSLLHNVFFDIFLLETLFRIIILSFISHFWKTVLNIFMWSFYLLLLLSLFFLLLVNTLSSDFLPSSLTVSLLVTLSVYLVTVYLWILNKYNNVEYNSRYSIRCLNNKFSRFYHQLFKRLTKW